jgi:hypothetical protein
MMPGYMRSVALCAFGSRARTISCVVIVSGAFSTPLFSLAMDGTMSVVRAVETLCDAELRCISFDFVEEVVDIYPMFDATVGCTRIRYENDDGVVYRIAIVVFSTKRDIFASDRNTVVLFHPLYSVRCLDVVVRSVEFVFFDSMNNNTVFGLVDR